MAPILIVACGNPLRSDDGLAWHAAEELGRAFPSSEAEILCVHQLTPELAEAASHAAAVIFIDAATRARPGSISCQPVPTSGVSSSASHHISPETVMSLAQKLYGASPLAFMVSMSGENFDHGEALSPTIADAIPLLVRMIQDLAAGLIQESPSGI